MFNSYERAIQLGKPVELYEFTNGGVHYYYTSADHNVVLDGKTYTAYAMKRTEISISEEKGKNNLTVRAQRNLPVADIFRVQPPSEVVTLSVFRTHEADPDGEKVAIWIGRVLNCKWEKTSEVAIYCEPVTGSLTRPGLRRLYQRQCPHVLYGTKCGINKTDYLTTAELTVISGTTLTSPTFGGEANDYFAGGFIQFDLPDGNTDRRFILSHTGNDIVINTPSSDLFVGINVNAYPGCAHTTSVCDSKFSNILNYGGFPMIPSKSPMEGSMF